MLLQRARQERGLPCMLLEERHSHVLEAHFVLNHADETAFNHSRVKHLYFNVPHHRLLSTVDTSDSDYEHGKTILCPILQTLGEQIALDRKVNDLLHHHCRVFLGIESSQVGNVLLSRCGRSLSDRPGE